MGYIYIYINILKYIHVCVRQCVGVCLHVCSGYRSICSCILTLLHWEMSVCQWRVRVRLGVCVCVWVCGAQLDVCVYGAGSGRWQKGTCFWWGLIGSRSGILSPLSSISRLSIFIALLLLNLFICPVTKSLFVCHVYPVLCFSVFLILSHIIFSFLQYFFITSFPLFFSPPLCCIPASPASFLLQAIIIFNLYSSTVHRFVF